MSVEAVVVLGRVERELVIAQGELQELKAYEIDPDLKHQLLDAMRAVKAARDRIEEALERARDIA